MSAQTGVRRRVTFTSWCHRCFAGWESPERDAKWHALMDLAGHEIDAHGGAEGRGEQ